MSNKLSDNIDPNLLKSNLHKALWVIDQLTNDAVDRFTPGQIAEFLVEKMGIVTSRQAVRYGLESDKKATHKNKSGYKLMKNGYDLLTKYENKTDQVIVIEPGKPFTTKYIILKDIFAKSQNILYISDPYVDIKTLYLIFNNTEPTIKIKLLTMNIIERIPGEFERHLKELHKESRDIEVGVYSQSELHDRYFFDNKMFWLSGNSLNNLGSKESFLVNLGEDIRQSMQATFNHRWKVARKL